MLVHQPQLMVAHHKNHVYRLARRKRDLAKIEQTLRWQGAGAGAGAGCVAFVPPPTIPMPTMAGSIAVATAGSVGRRGTKKSWTVSVPARSPTFATRMVYRYDECDDAALGDGGDTPTFANASAGSSEQYEAVPGKG